MIVITSYSIHYTKLYEFRPITIWPSPEKKLREIGERFEKIFVTELNMGQYLKEIERVMKRSDFGTLHKANGRPIAPLEMVARITSYNVCYTKLLRGIRNHCNVNTFLQFRD